MSAVTAAAGLSLESVVEATSGRRVAPAAGEAILTSVSIDSRTLEPGALFVAIRGPRFDGHDFLAAAHARGARADTLGRCVRASPWSGRSSGSPSH